MYEAPPTARAYLKGGRTQDSSIAKKELLCPAKHDLADAGYDSLGCLLFSDKAGVAPFWCGIKQDVAGARAVDASGSVGPTPMQVVGGVWAALQYILQNPDAGDNFPEALVSAHRPYSSAPLRIAFESLLPLLLFATWF